MWTDLRYICDLLSLMKAFTDTLILLNEKLMISLGCLVWKRGVFGSHSRCFYVVKMVWERTTILLLTFSVLLAVVSANKPFTAENMELDFYARKVKKVDYLAQMCSKTKTTNIEDCKNYESSKNGASTVPLVGFENYGLERDGKTPRQNDVISLTMNGIGAPTFTAGRCCTNKPDGNITEFNPSFSAASMGISYWSTVFSNKKARETRVCDSSTCKAPRFAFTAAEENEKLKNPMLSVLLGQIIEFNDKDNDGRYRLAVDGLPITTIVLKCLEWKFPNFEFSSNKTTAFAGEMSSWTMTSLAFDAKKSPFEGCRTQKPNFLPAGVVTLSVSTTDRPTTVDSTTPGGYVMTQKLLSAKLKVVNFPFAKEFNNAEVRPRIAFRYLVTTDNPKDSMFMLDRHTIQVKTHPHNIHKGYIRWEPLAKTTSKNGGGGVAAPVQVRLDRHQVSESVLLPRAVSHAEIPYNGLYGLFMENLIRRHVFKMDIAVGGAAYNPSSVEWEFEVAYGSIPVWKDYYHTGAILMIMFVIAVLFIVSFKKGWLIEYDWQTGTKYFDPEEAEAQRLLKEKNKGRVVSHYCCRKCFQAPVANVEDHPDMGYKYILPTICKCL